MKPGFTFIEILISIAVITVLVAVVATGIASFRESTNLNRSRDIVFHALKDARIRTLASSGASSFGVHFSSTTITLFRGNGYNQSDTANENKILPAITEIAFVNFESTTSVDIYFRRLTGEPSNTGTISIRSTRNTNKTLQINISASGLIAAQ